MIGTVGQVRQGGVGQPPDPYGTPQASSLISVVDGGPGVPDRASGQFPVAPPVTPDCSRPQGSADVITQSVNVYDAP